MVSKITGEIKSYEVKSALQLPIFFIGYVSNRQPSVYSTLSTDTGFEIIHGEAEAVT